MSTEQCLKLYRKAMRHMDNAAKMLSEKGKEEDGLYQNIKCVRAACGIAYSGLLLATECYLEMKGQPLVRKKGRRLKITQYTENLAQADSKVLPYFNAAYHLLRLDGYYEGLNNVAALKASFDSAMEIFKRIAPRDVSRSKKLNG
ncbi:MAG: hypothetical protein CRN43_18415 [Candidatus Nephrothrix sp. EaCA]|nr:MAG: hypothetical protein CRN43_18415 [Candidatus Nephrothrix sp. EaCA]